MASKPLHKHIAPRLASGDKRVSNAGALPEHIKRGLRLIAARENQSVSWVIEQLIYSYFGFVPPRFVGTREATIVDPTHHTKVIRTVSKEDKRPRQQAAAKKRAGQIVERSERAAVTH